MIKKLAAFYGIMKLFTLFKLYAIFLNVSLSAKILRPLAVNLKPQEINPVNLLFVIKN